MGSKFLKHLITSYFPGGLTSKTAPKFPNTILCDYYAMMEMEANEWRSKWGESTNARRRRRWKRWASTPLTAIEFLARINRSEVREIAEHISSSCEGLRVGVVSGFLPELAYCPVISRARMGVRALRTMVILVEELKKLGHPVSTLELAVGSVIRGIRLDEDEDVYVAISNQTITSHLFLCWNLRWALMRCPSDKIKIALELEPGFFFLLRNLKTLQSLADRIAGSRALKNRVFFNLDISHWRLANIKPNEVRGELARRILHAHISGHHHCAHFGDIPLYDLNTNGDYQPWLRLLKTLKEREDAIYDGGLSFELEVVRDTAQLTKALAEFDQV